MVVTAMLPGANMLNVEPNGRPNTLWKAAIFTSMSGPRSHKFADRLIHHECPFGPWLVSRSVRARVCNTVRILKTEINSWYSARSSSVSVPLLHFSASSSIRCWVTASARSPRSSVADSWVKTRPIGSTICSINAEDAMVPLYFAASIAAKPPSSQFTSS